MREIFNFNFEWTFFDGDVPNRNFNNIGSSEYKDPQWTKAGNNAVSKIGYDARAFEKIDLPHDFVVRRGEFSKDAPASLSLCGSENASTLTTRGLYEKTGYVKDLNLYGKFKKIYV